MKVPLTKGFEAQIDAEDYGLVSQYKWHYSAGYAYSVGAGGGKRIALHHFLLSRRPGLVTDHINGDPLDNRRSNLRHATHRQNLCNQKLSKANGSGYKGVSWYPRYGCWRAALDGRTLGYFENKLKAARAYDLAAVTTYGEYARINGR